MQLARPSSVSADLSVTKARTLSSSLSEAHSSTKVLLFAKQPLKLSTPCKPRLGRVLSIRPSQLCCVHSLAKVEQAMRRCLRSKSCKYPSPCVAMVANLICLVCLFEHKLSSLSSYQPLSPLLYQPSMPKLWDRWSPWPDPLSIAALHRFWTHCNETEKHKPMTLSGTSSIRQSRRCCRLSKTTTACICLCCIYSALQETRACRSVSVVASSLRPSVKLPMKTFPLTTLIGKSSSSSTKVVNTDIPSLFQDPSIAIIVRREQRRCPGQCR